MSNLNLPPAPEGHRWRIRPYAYRRELRLERKGLIFWKCVGRELINDYGHPQTALRDAANECLAGRDWLADVHAFQERRRRQDEERAKNFPTGVVK